MKAHLWVFAFLLVIPWLRNLLLSPVFIAFGAIFALLAIGILVLTSNILFGLILDRYYATSPSPFFKSAPGRTLKFSTPAAWQAALTKSQWSYRAPSSFPPLIPDFPVVSQSLNDMMIFVVRDFILTWYKDISSSPAFPTAVSGTIHSTLESLVTRIAHLDIPELLVRKLLPHITQHVKRFRDSEMTVRGSALERHLTRSEELDILVASRYGACGNLHTAIANLSTMTTRQDEEAYFRRTLDKILPLILPSKEASRPVTIVVREILSCLVLAPVMETISDPDFWNRTIDQAAGEAIQQQFSSPLRFSEIEMLTVTRKMISQVRQVLEKGTRREKVSQPHSENITFATDTKRFESFLRSIDRTNSLLDARRTRNDIIGEIRRTRLVLADNEDREWINGVKTETIVAFLDRLYTAKRHAETRISVLGGRSEDPSLSAAINEMTAKQTLRDILQNPSSLSYFMEFMDRRNRSQLVQFWLTVESFKDPLESLDSSSDDEGESLHPIDPEQSRMHDDVSMLLELYFPVHGTSQLLSTISSTDVEAMRKFAATPSQANINTKTVRRAILLSQSQIERVMEQDFVDFRNGDLWYRAIKDLPPPIQDTPQGEHQGSFLTTSSSIDSPRSVGGALAASSSSSPVPSIRQELRGSIGSLSNFDLLMEQSRSTPSATKAARLPLFEDAPYPGPSLFQETEDSEKMDQIQAALTDIIAHERFSDTRSPDSRPTLKGHNSSDGVITASVAAIEEDIQAAENSQDNLSGNIMSPTRLGGRTLRNILVQIDKSISDLRSQESMLSALIRKAELTGDEHKLHLLARSKRALDRETRELLFQKDQYEQQEAQSRISAGRTSVAIASATLQQEDGGKSYVRYLVEVRQSGGEGAPGTGWVIARRYNEFLSLHQKLKEEYSVVRSLEFPGKRIVTAMSPAFIDSRRIALEKYLQNVVQEPTVSGSDELGNFLSKDSPYQVAIPARTSRSNIFAGQTLVRNVYKSVTESIDDIFYGPSMLDVVIQSLTTQAAQIAGIVGAGVNDEELVVRAFKARADARSIPPEAQLLELSNRIVTLDGESITSSFSAPICDLILAIFELDPKNNWLRRQAIVIILQQVLGSTIERKVRDLFKIHTEESQILSAINLIKEDIWPKGQLNSTRIPRMPEERTKTRHTANQKLSAFMPDLVASMLGRSNARRGARRIFSVLQNRRLNQHLLYTILDEVVLALFPEAKMSL